MNVKHFSFFVILLTVFTSSAQESITLQGTVLNDTIAVSELNVVNMTLRRGTITNRDGVFEIPVRVNDTLNISAVQYESKQLVITPVVFKRKRISFYLIPKVNELDEVVISNIDLTGDLSIDMASVPLQVFIDPKDLGIPTNARPTMTAEERRVYAATSSSGGIVPIGALINAISGRTKMLKKHLEISRFVAVVERNRDKFSDSLYMKSLHIPEELIEDFVYYVFEDNEAVVLSNDGNTLGILEFMLAKSSLYLKLKEKEGVLSVNPKTNE